MITDRATAAKGRFPYAHRTIAQVDAARVSVRPKRMSVTKRIEEFLRANDPHSFNLEQVG